MKLYLELRLNFLIYVFIRKEKLAINVFVFHLSSCYCEIGLVWNIQILNLFIMVTCPCNEYPLTPHFYIVKVGFTGVYIIFLFLL